MKRPWLDILLDMIKDLSEDPKTLIIAGNIKNIHKNVTDYDDGTYSNINLNMVAYTENYIFINELLQNDSYQQIVAIPKKPHAKVKTWNYEEIMSSKDA